MSQEQDIFISALDVKPGKRTQYLRRACGNNTTLCQAVETLLDANEKVGNFLDVPALEQLSSPNLLDSSRAAELLFLSPSTDQKSLGRLDHYEILEVVGRGGMAIVMRARDTKLQRDVAIKVLAASGVARQNFVQEAQAIAAIRDEHVVTIHSVEDQGPVPYLVMEYIEGGTLESQLRETGAPGLAEILTIAEQIASGLSAIHRRGLVHRDVKPGNLLIEKETRRIRISDFGIAREVGGPATNQDGVLIGTPNYMSPEQAHGKSVDFRSDLFSLGSVLYELCTGQRPFDAPSTVAVLHRVCEERHRPAREVNGNVPTGLSDLIDRLLAKNPADRPASAEEVATRLHEMLSGETSGPSTHARRQLSSAGSANQKDRWHRINRSRRAVIAIGLLILAIGLTEASGVTQLGALVVRITSPNGNLIIEIDDPNAQVTIDGTEITISGAGSHEVPLRAGDYTIKTSRDGAPAGSEVVTVEHAGSRTIRIRREAPQEKPGPPNGLVLRQTLIGHSGPIASLVFSNDGKLLASGDDGGEVFVWNIPEGTVRYQLPKLGSPVAGLAFSPDNRFLVTSEAREDAGDYPIWIWDASTGEPQGELHQHKSGIFSLSFSADGKKLLSAGWESQVFVWDFPGKSLIRTIPSPSGNWVRSAVYSCTDKIAIASGDRVFFVQPDGRVSPALQQGAGPIGFFSSDGSRLASTWWRQGSVHVWDVEAQQELGSWKSHANQINAAAFANNNTILATVGDDGAIRIWNADTQELLAETICDSRLYWLDFSPDGKTLATGGTDDHLIKLWDVSFLESLPVTSSR